MDDDDWPMADPQIRKDYEAELGRFLLAHNEVDYRLTQVIRQCVTHLGGNSALIGRLQAGSFDNRLTIFELLQSFRHELKDLDVNHLRKLNADRNKLAHGHMDQNPFDGSYEILDRQKFQRRMAFPIDAIVTGRETLERIADNLNLMECRYEFDDLEIEDADPPATRN